jgi:hypothetical protein
VSTTLLSSRAVGERGRRGADGGADARLVSWISRLEAPGASGQIVLNGQRGWYTAAQELTLSAEATVGLNRIEAWLVDGRGPGLWRFLPGPEVAPESVQVIAGRVRAVDGGAVDFHLEGRAGERLVLTFVVAKSGVMESRP